jgi:hypothetical protein
MPNKKMRQMIKVEHAEGEMQSDKGQGAEADAGA